MVKNGLFLISIGMLIFMYSANQNTGKYNLLLLIPAIFLVVLGAFFISKDRKNKKSEGGQ